MPESATIPPSHSSRARRFATYLTWIAVSELAGVLGGFATASAIPTWYATLATPTWTPPNWVFGPVWTLLYALMGIAAARVWIRHRRSSAGKRSLALFGAQLAMNAAWPVLFFGLRAPGAALVAVVVLWAVIGTLILQWWRLEQAAAFLLIPYLVWVTFATALNAAILHLNP
jgi:benzodiazapine receptor